MLTYLGGKDRRTSGNFIRIFYFLYYLLVNQNENQKCTSRKIKGSIYEQVLLLWTRNNIKTGLLTKIL